MSSWDVLIPGHLVPLLPPHSRSPFNLLGRLVFSRMLK